MISFDIGWHILLFSPQNLAWPGYRPVREGYCRYLAQFRVFDSTNFGFGEGRTCKLHQKKKKKGQNVLKVWTIYEAAVGASHPLHAAFHCPITNMKCCHSQQPVRWWSLQQYKYSSPQLSFSITADNNTHTYCCCWSQGKYIGIIQCILHDKILTRFGQSSANAVESMWQTAATICQS